MSACGTWLRSGDWCGGAGHTCEASAGAEVPPEATGASEGQQPPDEPILRTDRRVL